jgi:hypothetical protein
MTPTFPTPHCSRRCVGQCSAVAMLLLEITKLVVHFVPFCFLLLSVLLLLAAWFNWLEIETNLGKCLFPFGEEASLLFHLALTINPCAQLRAGDVPLQHDRIRVIGGCFFCCCCCYFLVVSIRRLINIVMRIIIVVVLRVVLV